MSGKGKPLAYRLRALNNQVRRRLEKTAIMENTADLTGMQYGILGFIGDQSGDVYQKDIEAEFNIRRSTASGMLKLMERNGYIQRVYDTTDTRLKKITLTEKATELDKVATANIMRLQKQMTKDIDEEEMERFYRTLEKISRNLDE